MSKLDNLWIEAQRQAQERLEQIRRENGWKRIYYDGINSRTEVQPFHQAHLQLQLLGEEERAR